MSRQSEIMNYAAMTMRQLHRAARRPVWPSTGLEGMTEAQVDDLLARDDAAQQAYQALSDRVTVHLRTVGVLLGAGFLVWVLSAPAWVPVAIYFHAWIAKRVI
jgi:hypothetical protein